MQPKTDSVEKKKPHPANDRRATSRSSDWRRRLRRGAQKVLTGISSALNAGALVVAGLAAIIAAGIFLGALFYEATLSGVIISSLPVPKGLDDDGYSADVAAARLRDTMTAYKSAAEVHGLPRISSIEPAPITYPSIGMRIDDLADYLAVLLHRTDRLRVTGDFFRSGDELKLHLDLNRATIFDGSERITRVAGLAGAADRLVRDAADQFYLQEMPYVVVSYSFLNGKTSRAITVGELITTRGDPSNDDVIRTHFLLAEIFLHQGDLVRALQEIRSAKPYDRGAVNNAFLAQYYLIKFRDDERRNTLTRKYATLAIKMDSSYAESYNILGMLEADDRTPKLWDDARLKFVNAIERNGDERAYHDNLAVLDCMRGNYGEAVSQYNAARLLNEDSPNPLGGLGNVYFMQGFYDLAEANYEQALEKRPGYQPALVGLKALSELRRGILGQSPKLCENL